MSAAQAPTEPSVPHHRRRSADVQAAVPPRRLRLRIADWRMRTKLATVLVIPSLAFLVLAGAQTYSLAGQSTVLRDFAQEVSVGRQITGLVHQLQMERDRSVGELAAYQAQPTAGRNSTNLTVALRDPYAGVDGALSTFRLAAAPLTGGRAAWRVTYGRADEALNQLGQIRASVTAGAVNPATVSAGYSRMVDSLVNLLAQPSPGLERPELTDSVLRYVHLARVKEVGSRLRAKLFQAANAGRYGPTDLVELSDLRAQQLAALAEFRVVATEDQIRRYDEAVRDVRFRAATELEESTISGTRLLPAAQWWQASQQRLDLLRSVETGLLDDAVRQADNRSSAQLRQTLLVAGIILGILTIALLTSVAIGRSIARSLRSLREHALRVARADLPDTLERLSSVTAGVPAIQVAPAPVHSRDEVGEVAEAFLAVHRSAVNLAVEQAVMRRNVNSMFVNLARRSQVLVERQLELLDDLERDEADPDLLENLFKLDHLAARMRRNDESLLVLAGNESNRRWSDPVPLSTVVLAAIAEIEFYPRIQHDTDEDLHVVGHAVADLVHLLAELLENATVFSAPHTTVSLTGRAVAGDMAVLEITDEGLGMTPEALREANKLLSSPPAADVAASERMGLFVVSHLAARQGVRVQLRAARRGLVATVWLPVTVLAESTQRQLVTTPTLPVMPGPSPEVLATVPVPALVPAGYSAGYLPVAAPQPAEVVRVPAQRAVPAQLELPASPAPWQSPGRHHVPAQRGHPLHDAVTTELQVITVEADRAPGSEPFDDEDLPVAGRRPRPVSRRRSAVRTGAPRADNMIRSVGAGSTGNADSAWWSRQAAAARGPEPVGRTGPPAVPVTAGVNANGLPVRVPMAQLPASDDPPAETSAYVPAPSDEPDPDAVGSVLSRFYGGVRKAESEATTEAFMTPVGRRGEGNQR